MHQLAHQKPTVKYYSQVGSLLFTILLTTLNLTDFQTKLAEQELGTRKLLLVLILLLVAVLVYYLNYYTLSSIFWPARLSWLNWILLIPCGIITYLEIKQAGRLLTNITLKK